MLIRSILLFVLFIVSSCSYTDKSTPIYTGVLYFDTDTMQELGGRMVFDIDRHSDILKSFSEYRKFAYLNGVSDIHKHILIDENVITLDESATLIYAKIVDIERELHRQKDLINNE